MTVYMNTGKTLVFGDGVNYEVKDGCLVVKGSDDKVRAAFGPGAWACVVEDDVEFSSPRSAGPVGIHH